MKKTLLLLFSAVSLTAPAAEFLLQTPSAGIKLKGNKLVLVNLQKNAQWRQAPLRFTLDFASKPDFSKKNVPLPLTAVRSSQNGLRLNGRSAAWKWETRLSVRNRVILAETEYTNISGERQMFEAGAELTPDFRAEKFWDSCGKVYPADRFRERLMSYTTAEGQRRRGYSMEPFTLTAVGGSRHGIFTGFLPFSPVSWHGCSYDPARKILRFAQRFVADPGQTVTFEFVFGAVSTAYGLADSAVQQLYDSFPELWRVIGGQENPYVWGLHSHYQNWWGKPDPEHSRRHYYTIEWSYCPYKRSGDILMRPELWDYKPDNPFAAWPTPKYGGIRSHFPKTTREAQIKLRRERFRELGKKYGWMFYNSCAGAWCEKKLALSRYKDSIIYKKGKPFTLSSWSTGHDNECQMSNYHTSFGKVLYEDMAYLAKDLDLPGFALDCGSGGSLFRGSTVEKPLPGRAWDKEGLFIDSSVAVNHMVDFIHKLNPEAPLSAFTNGTLKGDYLMFERNYVHPEVPVFMPLGRWWIGPRPGCVHGHGHLFKDTVPNWRTLTPETFLPMISRLTDYALLNQFKYGLTNSYVTMYGSPQMYYVLPETIELMRAGWQSLVPLQLSPGLYAPYKARYGRSEKTFLYLANSSPKTSCGTVKVDNSELAVNGQIQLFVLKKRTRAATVNQVQGKYTAFEAVLPSRIPVLWESVCGIKGAPEKLTAQVTSCKSASEQLYTVKFTGSSAFTGTFVFPERRRFEAPEIRLNGKKVKSSTSLRIARGDILTILYRSADFRINEKVILKFPFVNRKNEVDFRVGFAGTPPGLRQAARRFNDYFGYCLSKGLIKGDGLCTFVTDPVRGENGMIVLKLAPGKGHITSGQDGGILISAPDIKEMNRLITALFYQMDRKFEYSEPFRNVMGLRAADFKAAGKRLPLIRCFD